MKYIKGQNRTQIFLFPVSLEDAVDPENEVRLIDAFVNGLKLDDFGFMMIAYNLKRIINSVGINNLIEYLTGLFSLFCLKFGVFKILLKQINQETMINQEFLIRKINTDSFLQTPFLKCSF